MLPLALALLPVQEVKIAYDPFLGLKVHLNGVPLVVGSSFDYLQPTSGRRLFSSRWSPKDVGRLPDGTIRVRYSGDNGNALGTHEFSFVGSKLTARYQFRWRGTGPVKVDNVMALVWAPAVTHGEITAGNASVMPYSRPANGDWPARQISGASNAFSFDSSLGAIELSLRGGTPKLYDARGWREDWAKGDSLLWLGERGRLLEPGQTLETVAEWDLRPRYTEAARPVVVEGVKSRDPSALRAPQRPFAVVPTPKVSQLSGWVSIEQGNGGSPESWREGVGRRWDLAGRDVRIGVETRTANLGLAHGGYEIRIQPGGVTVTGQDTAGIGHGLSTLTQLVTVKNGVLSLPLGTVRDWPSIGWRGVHLFAGRGSAPFHKRLANDVLSPLKFNHVVVQCERTVWDAAKESAKPTWTTKPELQTVFGQYRSAGVQPVPLIQSLGHMEWLLEGKNSGLAVNPDLPYTLDVRREAARDLLSNVWREAIDLLKPKTVHFGLDEVAMRGMPDDPTLALRLWRQHLPLLASLAQRHRVGAMIWGDMMLAPGEAPDAAHAKSVASAGEWRAALPASFTVADWHYLETDDPEKFKSLGLWKQEGVKTIATSWWRPRNIRAHTLAAAKHGAGTLQSTWAGYETTEASVLRDPEQFAAYVVAAEYAWSGRNDPPDKLPFDPNDWLHRALWAAPAIVEDQSGSSWIPVGAAPKPLRIGDVSFQLFAPVGLHTPVTHAGASGASEVVFGCPGPVTSVALALDCIGWERDGDPVATIDVRFQDGSLRTEKVLYGADVRAPEDDRPAVRVPSTQGLTEFRITLPKGSQVASVRLSPVSRTAGVRLHGVTTW